MRTIRDMFDIMGSSVQLYYPHIMEMIVNKYNNKIHKSLFNKFTPNQAQHNPIIEQTFIMEKQKELRDINMNNFKQYQLGDYLLCYIPYEIHTLGFKRRRNFDTLT
jgi:hypothetical protein